MALFSKRLTCFYCGGRPSKHIYGPTAKFHCEHCDADNYLDQNGEITDPPTEATNPPNAPNARFESSEFSETDLFCSQCLRNQHLYTSSLAAYFPDDDETMNTEQSSNYESYRRELEARYPQVCEKCEPRVKQQIRQAGYEAKADNLRRMMERSRASKAAQRAREHSWQSLIVYLGALGFWISIIGQLAWNIMGALTVHTSTPDLSVDEPVSFVSCTEQIIGTRRIPQGCASDMAPTAGIALVVGCLSLWWNPQLRMKVLGRTGKFSGLVEYYEVQLIFLVVRGVFWSLFKDPSSSGIDAEKAVVGHIFMLTFTIMCVLISRRVIDYKIRALVDWSDNSWEKAPMRSPTTSPRAPGPEMTPRGNNRDARERFPLERLGSSSRPAPTQPPAFPTPPPEPDDMDWTPSRPQQIQPTVSVYQRDRPSVFDGPSPFYGNIPAAPQPPSWGLRTRPSNRSPQQVVERNPFHRSPANTQTPWSNRVDSPEPVFKAPTFFPNSDYQNATGLETMFDQAFSIEPNNGAQAEQPPAANFKPSPSFHSNSRLKFQIFRFFLLLGAIGAWTFSQNHMFPIPGNYIETLALGSASLIAGLALLDVVKRPLADWSGLEILVNMTELGVSVHLGGYLPKDSLEREYFDRYGKLLLIFMAVQESMGLLASYRNLRISTMLQEDQQGMQLTRRTSPVGSPRYSEREFSAPVHSPTESTTTLSPTNSHFTSAPPLSFGTSAGSASFSSALPSASNYQLSSSQSLQSFNPKFSYNPTSTYNPHSFTMQSLKEAEPSDYEQDSDGETVATTATAWTNATNHNIRYGRRPSTAYTNDLSYSPRRNELGPGIGGLSLDDRPTTRRLTRSQTQQGLTGRTPSSRTYR
ncbi:hypothetical protein N7456_013174 [Penicillium angulare]|uniref:Ima1 N-terminal domain-containing protein n=1 Tax=Penicillium angulare TaxID=116970 RepID=A0A9W9JWK9_9EURO|nr:hypothetical protein N7456_013174 [Penicillium angulare]